MIHTLFARAGQPLAAATIIAAAVMVPLSPAMAAQTCSSTIKDGTVRGDISVEGSCTIESSNVEGAVIMKPGSQLVITGSTISGTLIGDKPRSIDLKDTRLQNGLTVTGSIERLKLEGSSVVGGPLTVSGATSMELIHTTVTEPVTLKDGSRALTLTDSSLNNGLSCNRGMTFRATGSQVNGTSRC